MPNNLTDNEIKKALECCDGTFRDCVNCPLDIKEANCWALEKLALDLINRLQAENEALINGQETLQKHIAKIQAENERLTHITRNLIGEIKAEAYTEFADKVKAKFCRGYYYLKIREKEFSNGIDNLLKEKIGNDMGRYDPYTDSFVKEKMVGDSNA